MVSSLHVWHASIMSHACKLPSPARPLWLDHPNNVLKSTRHEARHYITPHHPSCYSPNPGQADTFEVSRSHTIRHTPGGTPLNQWLNRRLCNCYLLLFRSKLFRVIPLMWQTTVHALKTFGTVQRITFGIMTSAIETNSCPHLHGVSLTVTDIQRSKCVHHKTGPENPFKI